MMKCWLDEWLDFLFPEPVEQDIDGHPVEHDWYAPLPKSPEYLRNTYEVTGTAEKADLYVRFWARSRR